MQIKPLQDLEITACLHTILPLACTSVTLPSCCHCQPAERPSAPASVIRPLNQGRLVERVRRQDTKTRCIHMHDQFACLVSERRFLSIASIGWTMLRRGLPYLSVETRRRKVFPSARSISLRWSSNRQRQRELF
ncbi:hypothetical protein LZ32DRAFT_189651 [Colletotrichum eremochloae]|nr:hypothetical protein LZ32DRAFT_189651 [Colletotrichum eremochloae]